jgi:C4-dicarboxylate transporter DctM subunit
MEVSNMTASLVLFLGSLLVMMCLGVPLFVTLAMASIVYMLASGQTFLVMMMARRIFAGINSFTLLAIPLFILCGDLLSSGKVSKMLISFAESLVGTMRGSLAIVTTVASMFFGAVSGSGVATASAIGSVVAPEAEAKGYDKKFIAAIVATSGALGILIPPSIPMVIYGAITGTSIAKLLLSGIGPGSIPNLVTTGENKGASKIIAAGISINMPAINRTSIVKKRNAIGLCI